MSLSASGDAAALAANRANSQRWSIFSGEAHDSEATEGSRTYAIVVCVFASLGGLYFGYDQGVTSGTLKMTNFVSEFKVGSYESDDGWYSFKSYYNVIYYMGCFFGAFVANFACDLWGRRATIFSAGFCFCVGTSWAISVSPGAHGVLLGARFLLGVGVGTSSFSLPIFGAEMAPKELRGMLSGFMQMTVVIGLLAAGIVNFFFRNDKNGWRISNGVAMIPPVIVMLGIFFVPESPRWQYRWKGRDAAQTTLVKLRQTDKVHQELDQIGTAITEEGEKSIWDFSEILTPAIRKRVFIAMALQLLQQATGINPTITYGGDIFEGILGKKTVMENGVINQIETDAANATISLTVILVLMGVNCLSTIPAMLWVDKYGRRTLLLIGAVGMVIGHVVSGIAYTAGCDNTTKSCSTGSGYTIIAFACMFIFSFAISWGPICWIYPAEIFPMNVRAKAVGLSTMTNWLMGTLMMFTPKAFDVLRVNGVFFVFTVLCGCCGVFVYFFCPETMGISLEDMDAIFSGKKVEKYPNDQYAAATTPDNKNVTKIVA